MYFRPMEKGEEPIYIVTGHGPRCGSSMIMKGLQAGGMTLAFDPDMDDEEHSPGGRFELSSETQAKPGFPAVTYAGQVVKAFPWPWSALFYQFFCYPPFPEPITSPVCFKVLWLHRSYSTRCASFKKANPNLPLTIVDGSEQLMLWRDQCADFVLKVLRFVDASQGIHNFLTELDYNKVVDYPVRHFRELEERGWPIEPHDAGAVVDPELRHCL